MTDFHLGIAIPLGVVFCFMFYAWLMAIPRTEEHALYWRIMDALDKAECWTLGASDTIHYGAGDDSLLKSKFFIRTGLDSCSITIDGEYQNRNFTWLELHRIHWRSFSRLATCTMRYKEEDRKRDDDIKKQRVAKAMGSTVWEERNGG